MKYLKCLVHLIPLVLTLLITAVSYSSEIDSLNTAIKGKGAKWVAEENPLSILSPEEKRMRLGAFERGAAPEKGLTQPPYVYAPLSLPPVYDWRNVSGSKYVTPVRNQGNCGSCWAFAATAALESKALITLNLPGTDLDLSEQIVVSCSGAGSCNGGQPSAASNFLVSQGTDLESCYPYTETDGNCSSACSNWRNDAYRIDGWRYVSSGSPPTAGDVKNAIYTNGPVIATFDVYEDFYSYSSGVYSYVSGSYLGGHAVLIVGWDDAVSAFIVKNSWSPGWGESGYFKIAYSELTGTTKFARWAYAYGNVYLKPKPSIVDFDGDKKTDIAIYRASTGAWYIIPSSTPASPYGVGWGGNATDKPMPGDYDGDGKTDVVIYRAGTGAWYIFPSSGAAPYGMGWGGNASDISVSGDYDGDKKTDLAMYRTSTGAWYINPSSGAAPYGVSWGGDATDKPVPGDYDGDGKTDIAVYRVSTGAWYIIPSSTPASAYGVGWGGDATDKPVPGDYDGDGKTDVAIYRASTGAWYIFPSSGAAPYGMGWGGNAGDMPVSGDYDGDRKTDLAVYRTSTGAWYINPSSGAAPYGVGWGGHTTDLPVILNLGSID